MSYFVTVVRNGAICVFAGQRVSCRESKQSATPSAADLATRWRQNVVLNSVVLGPFFPQERHGSLQLVEPVHAIFHRDPTGELRARQDAKDRVVVDQAPADLAVP